MLERFKHRFIRMERVMDCGAGVGRVAKNLLSNYFNEIVLVEPCKHLLNQAKEELKDKKNKFQYLCKGS